MTMAHERTRALIWAREFLRDIRAERLTPEEAKHQANVILRHYPDLSELDSLGAARERDAKSSGMIFCGPMLARIVDGKAAPERIEVEQGGAVQTDATPAPVTDAGMS